MKQSMRQRHVLRFAMLFVVALGNWWAFQALFGGAQVIIPGMVVAVILAAAGSFAVRRLEVTRDALPRTLRLVRHAPHRASQDRRRIARASMLPSHRNRRVA